MLPSFDLSLLLLPTFAIVVATVVATWAATRSPLLCATLALFKAGLFAVYFGLLFDGTYTFLDDWSYLERGSDVQAAGVTLFNFLDNIDLLLVIGQGEHFLYYLYNATALQWFGPGYFAPVALNVMVTTAISAIGTRIAVAEGLVAPDLRPALFTWLMLHPDIVSWSTVSNTKDILVLFLHVVLLNAVSHYFGGRHLRAAVQAAAAAVILFFLRHYVPLLFGAAFAVAAFWSGRGLARAATVATAGLLLLGTVAFLGIDTLLFAVDLLRADLVNPLLGFPRFLLTPVPFGTEPAYAFLNAAALAHWLLMPAAVVGLARVVGHRTPFSRVLIAYLAVFAALYAAYGELQGPRHRVQLDYVLALLQFIGVCAMVARRAAPTRRDAAQAPSGQLVAP